MPTTTGIRKRTPYDNRPEPRSRRKARRGFFVLANTTLAPSHKKSTFVHMSATAIIRTRIDPRRKTRAEAILSKLGITPTQAINMLYAQIELRKAIPFPLTLEDNSAIAPPIEHVAQVWDQLDNEDYSDLLTKKP